MFVLLGKLSSLTAKESRYVALYFTALHSIVKLSTLIYVHSGPLINYYVTYCLSVS
jgi:hypothetical protein